MSYLTLYNYVDLLKIIYDGLDTTNSSEKLSIPHPQLVKMTGKKIIYANFPQTCEALKRSPEHFQSFIVSELSTDFSVDSNGRLILKDKFKTSQMESIISSYLKQYVKCGECKKYNTELQKDQITRLTSLVCKECKSSNTVGSIKAGFHATTRSDRKK